MRGDHRMKYIIPLILKLIKYLNKNLFLLQCFLVNKYMEKSPSDNPVSEKYRALKIDAMPIIEKRQLHDYNQLLKDYLEKHGKPLKPVNRRSKFLPHPELYALFVVPLMSIFTTTPAEEVNLVVRFANQRFSLTGLT